MVKTNTASKKKSLTIADYLNSCKKQITMKQYLDFEFIRAKSFKSIQPKDWSNLLIEQNFCCYYCCTDIRVIQELIFNGAINPRKRGVNGYSGFHFEIDHKNANKDDNSVSNIAAACYYCNNDIELGI